ncbi:MAG: hydroxymethylbilane synthase [Planctomycetota bacterium]
MRRSRKPITIASRQSPLARVQAEMVGRGLSRLHPNLEVHYVWVMSEGDRVGTGSLAEHGGKGLFTKAVERAVLDGRADIGVHSMKDLPADELTPGLQIAAVPKRADVRDALLGPSGPISIDQLADDAVVGTTSPRRAAQLLRHKPGLQIRLLRGNVGTRLAKLIGDPSQGIAKEADATLLAIAGLSRLGRRDLITQALPLQAMLPAACQGALGIQCRRDDHVSLTRLLPLNDPQASTAIHTERDIVAGLGADCHSPVAVLAEQVDPSQTHAERNADSHWFRVRARVLSPDGAQLVQVDEQCKTQDLRRMVKQIIKDLNAKGARDMLKAARAR